MERCELYDDHLERERRLQKEKEQGAMGERHTNVALHGMNVAVKALESLVNKVQTDELLSEPVSRVAFGR